MEVDYQKELDAYVHSKMIQSMMFYKNVSTILEHPIWQGDIMSVDFLKALRDIIKTNKEYQFIEPLAKDNLHRIINHIRFNNEYSTKTKKRLCYHFYNDLTVTLNGSGYVNQYKYYLQELNKRYDSNRVTVQILDKLFIPAVIEQYKDSIFSSIATDFGVIVNQSEAVEANSFYEQILPLYVVNNDYIDSLNAITCEFPFILTDPTFLERTYDVLNQNKVILKELKDDVEDARFYKDLSKRNNKVLKKVSRLTK